MTIIGLGNPGIEYEKTRHNVGFMFVDFLQNKLGASEFESHKKSESEISQTMLDGKKFYLIKPQTFMNRSGESVKAFMDFYKIPLSELVVVHDDLDIDFGKFKIQNGVGPKVHNGINNIEDHVGSKEFVRVRIGVNEFQARGEGFSGERFVLENLNQAACDILKNEIFPLIESEVLQLPTQQIV